MARNVSFPVKKINVYEMELKAPFLLTFTFNSWIGNCMSEFMGLIYGKYEAKVST